MLILVMELIYNAVWFTDTILNCKCKKLPTNFNRPSAQNSNISIVFKIGLERASVTVKDKSVLFFLLMLGGNSDVICDFYQEDLTLPSGFILHMQTSTMKLVRQQ